MFSYIYEIVALLETYTNDFKSDKTFTVKERFRQLSYFEET